MQLGATRLGAIWNIVMRVTRVNAFDNIQIVLMKMLWVNYFVRMAEGNFIGVRVPLVALMSSVWRSVHVVRRVDEEDEDVIIQKR